MDEWRGYGKTDSWLQTGKLSWYDGEPKYQWKKPQYVEEDGNPFLGFIIALSISILLWVGLFYGISVVFHILRSVFN